MMCKVRLHTGNNTCLSGTFLVLGGRGSLLVKEPSMAAWNTGEIALDVTPKFFG